MPFATCFCGSVPAASGRRIENFGNTGGTENASFSDVDFRLMTEFLFISVPVAGSVSTQPKGTASVTSALSERIFQGSPFLKSDAAAMNLTASMTDPPPAAII